MSVISLAERKKQKADETEQAKPKDETEADFQAIQEANRIRKEKQEKQRQLDNRNVKRSYRLDKKKGK